MAEVFYGSIVFPEHDFIWGPSGSVSGDFNIRLQKRLDSGAWVNVSEVKPWEKYRIIAMKPAPPVGMSAEILRLEMAIVKLSKEIEELKRGGL